MASLDIWKFYLIEDLATGPVYDLDHFSPSYRKQNDRPYDPVLRQGLNNSHVEQVYALLGLREGEEAIGWKTAWDQAQSACIPRPRQSIVPKHPFRRLQPMRVDKRTRVTDSLNSRELSDRLTITVDYREASEPVSSVNVSDSHFPLPPRRAASESFTEAKQQTTGSSESLSNQTTTGPQQNFHGQPEDNEDMISVCSNLTDSMHPTRHLTDQNRENGIDQCHQPRSSSELSDVLSNGHKICIDTMLIESCSEDEAFHEGTGGSIDGEDRSLDDDLSEECLAARSAAFDYHRAATLQRLTRRTSRNMFSEGGLSHPSVETGLGCESDSVHSGSAASNHVGGGPLAGTDNLLASTSMFAAPHQFNFTGINVSSAHCYYCQTLLLSFGTNRQVVKCVDCGYLCHEKCAPFVPKTCRPLPNAHGAVDATMRAPGRPHSGDYQAHKLGTILSPNLPWRNDRTILRTTDLLSERDSNYHSTTRAVSMSRQELRIKSGNLPPRRPETPPPTTGIRIFPDQAAAYPKTRLSAHLSDAAFYGWLYKMGHRRVLQQWKKRFFVLSTDRHQLRYYDTSADEVVRGCIDLQEVRVVKQIKNYVQLRGTDCAVFELETSNRTYRFAAESVAQANDWIERIQNTIQ